MNRLSVWLKAKRKKRVQLKRRNEGKPWSLFTGYVTTSEKIKFAEIATRGGKYIILQNATATTFDLPSTVFKTL